MSRQSLITAILTLVVVSFAITTEASAQRRAFTPRPLRWLGQGFGDGYHRCSPGYDSSHYNPYSEHNSFLYSQTPQFQQLSSTQNYAMQAGQAPQFFGGVPFSVYAAPPRSNGYNMQPLTGPTIDNSFEPVVPPKPASNSEEEADRGGSDFNFDDDSNLFAPERDKQPIGSSVIEKADSVLEETPDGPLEGGTELQSESEEADESEESADQNAVYRRWIGPRLIPASYGKQKND